MIPDLNKKFGIEGIARIVAGNGGLPAVVVSSPVAQATCTCTAGR